jgi:hypothetical protein
VLLLTTKAASTEELFISSKTATKVLLSLSSSVSVNRFDQSQASIAHELKQTLECGVKEHKQNNIARLHV